MEKRQRYNKKTMKEQGWQRMEKIDRIINDELEQFGLKL